MSSPTKMKRQDNDYYYFQKDLPTNIHNSSPEFDIYNRIISKYSDFSIFSNSFKTIILNKKSLQKICMLSSTDPIEQILFTLYKTISPIKDKDEYKYLSSLLNKSQKKQKIKNPLSDNKNNYNISIKEEKIIEEEYNENESDNDNKKESYHKIDITNQVHFENLIKSDKIEKNPKTLSDVLCKWFYLTLALCGFFDFIHFIYCLFNLEIKICFYIYFLFVVIITLLYTGFYGFRQVNKKKFNDRKLIFLTFLSIFFSLLSFFLARISDQEKIKEKVFYTDYVNLMAIILGVICYLLLEKLKNEEEKTRPQKQRLVSYNDYEN